MTNEEEEAITILRREFSECKDTISVYARKRKKAFDMAIKALEQQPKTGHWIDTGSGQECSECGEIQYGYDNFRCFCANCGAKMEVEEE